MSRSQNGEDLIVKECFPAGFVGCVLEIGAWEAVNLSNSRLLIESGWAAVLCEFSPAPVSKLVREYADNPRVQIVQAAITPGPQHVIEFHISDDALSTNDAAQLRTWKDDPRNPNAGGYYGKLWVQSLSLHALLDQFFGGDRRIDFASIDTEGSSPELAITLLKTDHRPKVLCVEHNGRGVEIMAVAQQHRYKMIHMNQENLILERSGK